MYTGYLLLDTASSTTVEARTVLGQLVGCQQACSMLTIFKAVTKVTQAAMRWGDSTTLVKKIFNCFLFQNDRPCIFVWRYAMMVPGHAKGCPRTKQQRKLTGESTMLYGKLCKNLDCKFSHKEDPHNEAHRLSDPPQSPSPSSTRGALQQQ